MMPLLRAVTMHYYDRAMPIADAYFLFIISFSPLSLRAIRHATPFDFFRHHADASPMLISADAAY